MSRDRSVPDPSQEAEPEPAALDELLRAFGIDDQLDDELVDELLRDPTPSRPTAPYSAVISINDEERPDPVYIDGQLDSPRGGLSSADDSVVFIEDDDTADALVATGKALLGRGTMDPKMRDRRIAVRRSQGRRRLRWFTVVGVVVVLLIGVLAVLGSPMFSIDAEQVTVTGDVYTDPVQLAVIIDEVVGTPTLIVDTRTIEQRLESIAWVDEARVRTRFPSSLSIEIRERSALATYRGGDGRFRVIDREGRVLDVIDGQPVAYMLLTGPDALDLRSGQFTTSGYAAAAELVQALTPSVRSRTVSIDVTGDGSQLRLFLDDGVEVRFGAANDLLVKLVRLETVLPIADERNARILDVSTAEVTVR